MGHILIDFFLRQFQQDLLKYAILEDEKNCRDFCPDEYFLQTDDDSTHPDDNFPCLDDDFTQADNHFTQADDDSRTGMVICGPKSVNRERMAIRHLGKIINHAQNATNQFTLKNEGVRTGNNGACINYRRRLNLNNGTRTPSETSHLNHEAAF